MKVLVIVTVALLQVHQAYSFYSFFQSNPAPLQQPQQPQVDPAQQGGVATTAYYNPAIQHHHHHQNHHHGGHGGFFPNAGAGATGAMGLLSQAKHFITPQLGHLKGTIMTQWTGLKMNPYLQTMVHAPMQHLFKKEFYNDCGKSIRHCEWIQRHNAKPMNSKLARAQVQQHVRQTQEANAKTEMDYTCFTINHVCVGNTENCVSNRSCDVSMKITETILESNGVSKSSAISSISHLNNCHMEGQSVTDNSRMPQALFGIGFATYNEAGQAIECRAPKASDFKLVFLWKNSTVEESESDKDNGRCKPKPHHHPAVHVDHEMMNTVRMWPTICKTMENKEGAFNLKSFLTTHVPTIKYTSFFSPPFAFADNYEPSSSSNGMVISGAVSIN